MCQAPWDCNSQEEASCNSNQMIRKKGKNKKDSVRKKKSVAEGEEKKLGWYGQIK